jgi:HEAT repeat protein
MLRTVVLASLFGLLTGSGVIEGQEKSPANPETALLVQGWGLLARGDAAGATRAALLALKQEPNSSAALTLAIDAEVERGGFEAALTTYEQWLGTRRLEDAYSLRRVARALLRQASVKSSSDAVRQSARAALAADGDTRAIAAVEASAAEGSLADARARAAEGDERAVKLLIDQLRSTQGIKSLIIEALGNSGSKTAIGPLRELLSDPQDINRAAAADALGQLEATEAIPQLRALLKDQFFAVKLKAAGALYRLNDSSGLGVLTEVTQSEHAAIRVAGARELAARPDASWQSLVRSLTEDPDPVVRLEAARLIAPYDQPLAKSVLDALQRNENPAIREAAAAVLVDRVAADIATLRGLLHSGDMSVRVKAAGRILELTR